MRPWVALDRDGTLIEEQPYLSDPGRVRLLPGAAQAVRRLREMGLPVVLLTNQSGIGRGYFGLEMLEEIHARLFSLLAEEGAALDGVYFCPHLPAAGCPCRKPGVGLLQRAARDLGLRPQDAFVIGDKESDIELGRRARATAILVETGWGSETALHCGLQAHFVVADLWQAAQVIASCTKAGALVRA
jgi:histidinol-phosphate phosphatase family protein